MGVKIIECPRDAMQGLNWFVPTKTKIDYINTLLQVGYHTLDCGSFVSPMAIPQMRDTKEVLDSIDDSETRLSVIVANKRGIDDAVTHERVQYLGFPFSVSETFQQRNTNSSIEDSIQVVEYLMEQSAKHGKEVVIYISMGFGNNYGDDWSPAIVEDWVGRIEALGVSSFSISDTVGVSNAESIQSVFKQLNSSFSQPEFGAHFHTRQDDWEEKVEAAWRNGCRRFDGAINGFGGCPMAEDELVGNMPTENLIQFFEANGVKHGLDMNHFGKSMKKANSIFG
jgi:hydroxymethylglutaryl-CoA lyase